jgi:uncharacterized protein (TIGR01777 family)
MRIILTGGTGLIGQALTNDLAEDGHEVTILSRKAGRDSSLTGNVRLHGWDGRTSEGWGFLVDGADAIVNLAGESIAAGRWTETRKRHIRDSRVYSGQAVVDAVTEAQDKPKVIIQSSAVGYYGPRGDEELTEDASPGDDFLAQVALEWEESTAPVEEMGVRRAIIRTGVVLSCDGGAFPRLLLPFKFYAGGPLGSGQQYLPWIHIADEVAAIRFLIENDKATGPFNLAAPHPLTNADFGRVLGKVLGKPARMPAPSFALRLAFGDMSTVLLDGQRAIPRRLLDLGFDFRFPEAEAALRDLLQ